jgi:hypothetical protein
MTSVRPLVTEAAANPSLDGAIAALSAMGHAAWLVDPRHGTIVAGNAEAGHLLERRDLAGLDAEAAIPSLEDMAYWDGVRNGAVDVLDSETEIALSDGRLSAASSWSARPRWPSCAPRSKPPPTRSWSPT